MTDGVELVAVTPATRLRTEAEDAEGSEVELVAATPAMMRRPVVVVGELVELVAVTSAARLLPWVAVADGVLDVSAMLAVRFLTAAVETVGVDVLVAAATLAVSRRSMVAAIA